MVLIIFVVILFACYAEFIEQLYKNDKVAYDLIIIAFIVLLILTGYLR